MASEIEDDDQGLTSAEDGADGAEAQLAEASEAEAQQMDADAPDGEDGAAPIDALPETMPNDPSAVTVPPAVEQPAPVDVADLPAATAMPDEEAQDEDSQEAVHPLIQDLLLNPLKWRIWPAVAMLRWLLRNAQRSVRGLIYRSKPSLAFEGSEIQDVAFEEGRIDLVLTAPGMASVGSPLPTSDVARVVENTRPPGTGALGAWLDGPTDRFMQAVEEAESSNNAAFALATGGRIEALRVVAEFAGRTAPLTAWKGGTLSAALDGDAEGAMGLAPLFVGPISASGLAALVQAFTSLPVEVKEFAGAEIMVLRPARLGSFVGRILGTSCKVPSAGVDVIIDGRQDADSMRWVSDPARRRSVALLCEAYMGMQSPVVRAYLHVNPEQITPAAFDYSTELGGVAVLGGADEEMLVPITYEAA